MFEACSIFTLFWRLLSHKRTFYIIPSWFVVDLWIIKILILKTMITSLKCVSYKSAKFYFRWSYLEVYTNGAFDDLKQAYAAGLAEAYLTKQLIAMHWYNTYRGYCSKPLTPKCEKLQAFINKNLKWMSEQIIAKAAKDEYWHQVLWYAIYIT